MEYSKVGAILLSISPGKVTSVLHHIDMLHFYFLLSYKRSWPSIYELQKGCTRKNCLRGKCVQFHLGTRE